MHSAHVAAMICRRAGGTCGTARHHSRATAAPAMIEGFSTPPNGRSSRASNDVSADHVVAIYAA
jgi:hypothetical protein